MTKASFRDQGIAERDRLTRHLWQAACSGKNPPTNELATRVENEALATIQWPTGSQYSGDWGEGEKLA